MKTQLIIKNLRSYSNLLAIRESPDKTRGCRVDTILETDYSQCQQMRRSAYMPVEYMWECKMVQYLEAGTFTVAVIV